MIDPTRGPDWKRSPSQRDRLGSWKEIAAYLDRGLTTVYRWERKEGLPVHRQVHEKKSTVYAYRSEIDDWLSGRRCTGWGNAGSVPRVPPAALVPILFTALLSLVLLGGILSTNPSQGSDRGASRAQVWILLATFDNGTGEEIFDGTLRSAVERELINSHFARVVPRTRLDEVLELMKRPPGSLVDSKTGREICLRDGQIRALLTGSIEKVGPSYILSARVVDPVTGVSLASISEQAENQSQVLPAMQRLTGAVRAELEQKLAAIEARGQRLERATTPSLSALELYTDGIRCSIEASSAREPTRLWTQAKQLLEEAVALDPSFASASVFLGWALYYLNDQRWDEESLGHLKRARELAAQVTYSERLFIDGSYRLAHGELEAACITFQALADQSPAHYWAVHNAALSCERALSNRLAQEQKSE